MFIRGNALQTLPYLAHLQLLYLPEPSCTTPDLQVLLSIMDEKSSIPSLPVIPTPTEDESAGLPPYSGPSTAPQASQALSASARYSGLPKLNYKSYSPPQFTLSKNCQTLSSSAEHLSTNANALVALIRELSAVPPKPQLRVRGTRQGHVDFDLQLNLMPLLVPDDEKRRMDYIRCVAEGEMAFRGGLQPGVSPNVGGSGLEEWCRRFVQDQAAVKSFTLERIVANLDADWIEGQIRSLLASLNYQGAVTVTLSLTHSRVLVHSPHKVNEFFTSITSIFSGKSKYEVVKAVWPFAATRNGEPNRRCAVQSEQAWWKEWKDPIRHAISQKRKGWVTVEDKLEVAMSGPSSATNAIRWEPEHE